ncbi:UDP-glucose/GDP-mannose dehydrogenase family protein [Clostridiaceae bacterium M8S5]|nr:UDP-glucose/GDP-mannose dehydrogenase family protein [Clostridiaceae bacterium M8S5]
MNSITIIGSGYVGLVCGACLADFGMNVICVDKDKEKIDKLNCGIIPIYEQNLEALIKKNRQNKRLEFTTDISYAIKQSKVIFIAVGTPAMEDGKADLNNVLEVAKTIGKYMNGYKVIVNKSTVPIGTAKLVKKVIKEILDNKGVSHKFDMVSNPEFLREGSAVYDFTNPDRIVLGVDSKKATRIMKEVYRVLYLSETPFVITNIETAEMIKYASNAFLAMKITYINQIANLCEKVGADVCHVAKAMGMDQRIGSKFLNPGPGYGGSCFPKDTNALFRISEEKKEPVTLIKETIKANEHQKHKMAKRIKREIGNLNGKTIGVLGLTFKPKTDDMRESPAITILNKLSKYDVKFKVYDPQGHKESAMRLQNILDKIKYCENEYDAVTDVDAIVILTEWNEFRTMDLQKIKKIMKGNYFFDFRNIYDRNIVEKLGFKYYCVGR